MAHILNYLADRLGIVAFLTGIVFIITAFILYRFPPKKINYLYGYRTPSSMRNQQVWDFSQRYSAIKMFQLGIIMLAISFINTITNISQDQSCVLDIIIMILGFGWLVLLTERAIKKNFPKE